jgi:hypothetical protein
MLVGARHRDQHHRWLGRRGTVRDGRPPRSTPVAEVRRHEARVPDRTFRDAAPRVADWAAGNGFEVLEIACWPQTTGQTRRYARHPRTSTSPTCRRPRPQLMSAIAAQGLSISGLGFYPSPLHPDPAHPSRSWHLKHVIRRREDGCAARQHLHGRRLGQGQDENWRVALESARHRALRSGSAAADHRTARVFSRDEWPASHSIAWSPSIGGGCRQWGGTIGLSDPSHLVWLMIDRSASSGSGASCFRPRT